MAETLREILKSSIGKAIAHNNVLVGHEVLPHGPNPIAPVSYASPQDVYENEVGYVSPFAHFSPGRNRSRWSIPDVAVTHTPVSSLLSSGQSISTQTNQIIGGAATALAPAAAVGLSPVPNMQLLIKANGPVHVATSLTVKSTNVSDTISFAFFRNGLQISQVFTHTTPSVANTPDLVNLSIIDSDIDVHNPLNFEVYALYWKSGAGTLSAVGTQRGMYLINLTPS